MCLVAVATVTSSTLASCTQTKKGLSAEDAKVITQKAISERDAMVVAEYDSEWNAGILQNGEYSMPFITKIFGDEPADGRAMYISMHGGGGAPQELNDQQWENQKRLYTPAEGVYFVPRAPTNSWDLWHQEHIDLLMEKAIALAIIHENVNPNKVYIMGYSAGGDGTFQLAPRLADHFAAAAMSAGHPGDAQIESLRNIPFALYMGGKDGAYDRNLHAAEWKEKLAALEAADKGGYIHDVQIYPQHGHWMEHDDTVSMQWMPQFTRNAIPEKVVWVQDDIARKNFYWLGATGDGMAQNSKIVATYSPSANRVDVVEANVNSFIVSLNDKMMDLDKEVAIYYNGEAIFEGEVERKAANIQADIDLLRDRDLIFPVKIKVTKQGDKFTATEL